MQQERPFNQRMRQGVQHRRPNAPSSDPQAEHHQAAVFDRRVSRQPFQVLGPSQVDRRHQQRQPAEQQQHVSAPSRHLGRPLNGLPHPENSYESAPHQRRRNESRRRCRCAVVGVDPHGAERENLDFRTIPHQNKQECEFDIERIPSPRRHRLRQSGIRQVGHRLGRFPRRPGCRRHGRRRSHRTEQQHPQVSHRNPHRTDEDILPGCLQAPQRPPVVGQSGRRQGRRLEENPRHGDVIRQINPRQSQVQCHERDEVDFALPQRLPIQVPDALPTTDPTHQSHQTIIGRSKRVEREVSQFGRPAVQDGPDRRRSLARKEELGEKMHVSPFARQGHEQHGDRKYNQQIYQHGNKWNINP